MDVTKALLDWLVLFGVGIFEEKDKRQARCLGISRCLWGNGGMGI